MIEGLSIMFIIRLTHIFIYTLPRLKSRTDDDADKYQEEKERTKEFYMRW